MVLCRCIDRSSAECPRHTDPAPTPSLSPPFSSEGFVHDAYRQGVVVPPCGPSQIDPHSPTTCASLRPAKRPSAHVATAAGRLGPKSPPTLSAERPQSSSCPQPSKPPPPPLPPPLLLLLGKAFRGFSSSTFASS